MAEYDVVFLRAARRALSEDLPETVAAAAFEFVMGALRANPRRVGKPLRDRLSGLWSARRGDYRVIYRIIDDRVVIEVIAIAHRRDVYRP